MRSFIFLVILCDTAVTALLTVRAVPPILPAPAFPPISPAVPPIPPAVPAAPTLLSAVPRTPSVLASPSIASSSQPQTITAETIQGSVQGLRKKTRTGKPYYSFEGVPYAQPPVGLFRFSKPRPLLRRRRRSQPYLAHAVKPSCYGLGVAPGAASEDCLYLDIYVPAHTGGRVLQQRGPLSVLVFLHGGGFVAFSGQPSMDKLMSSGGAMFVFVHYRLGPFGFLSTGARDLRGNMGLWDQNMALQWLRDNVRGFGGDPGKITLMGQSAGGASVAFQALAPPSRDLFQRAVLLSGSATATWALQRDPQSIAFQLGRDLGCGVIDSKGQFRPRFWLPICLRLKPAEEIFAKSLNLTFVQDAATKLVEFLFVPVVDGEFVVQDPLAMHTNESHLLSQGLLHKDFIVGIVNNEGSLMFNNPGVPKPPVYGDFMSRDLIPHLLHQRYGRPSPPGAVAAISSLYTGSIERRYLSALGTAHVYGDPAFVVPAFDFSTAVGNLQLKYGGRGRTYFQLMDFCPRFSPHLCMMHGMDAAYLFPPTPIADATDAKISSMHTELITSFSQTGIPRALGCAVRWKPFNQETGYSVLKLKERPSIERTIYSSRLKLWLNLIPSLEDKS